jgi:hypothetical protein
MKKVNMLKYLEVIGEGNYEVYINKGEDINDAINEEARSRIYFSSKDDCDYIDIAVEAFGADIIEEGALQAAQIGHDIERGEKYIEQIEKWIENLEFEDIEEDIKKEIIKDIVENEMELKIIESLRKNDYNEYLQIIRKFTYADIDE